ncbi:MAG TPA: hypothetical protein PK625_02530 [Spirochaetales bacterium]|nr:hypothetical protein [Spirochaetales bacterium]MBP7265070.1 hypothetical protein [Spirochaetia bacterium]HPE35996.1 hypothetical protein [Spirochaetales bacterium]
MDTKNGLVVFILFVVLFAFAFVFSDAALAQENTFYGILALVGFLVCLFGALFNGVMGQKAGDALAVWFFVYAVVVGVVLVWFLTRVGTSFGWW